jgi:hypothetical protein
MTDQHRATPEEWEYIRLRAEAGVLLPNCLLELRARIESLEAAPQDKLDRLIALDAADPTPDPAMTELRAASAEAQPAGGLVERVAARIEYGIDASQDPEGIARGVIREQAAAASQMHASQMYPDKNLTWERVAQWLELEANQ